MGGGKHKLCGGYMDSLQKKTSQKAKMHLTSIPVKFEFQSMQFCSPFCSGPVPLSVLRPLSAREFASILSVCWRAYFELHDS